MSRKHDHYYKDVRHLSEIDVYRVLDLFGVTSPPIQHAIKKLLLPGGRGAKGYAKDLGEAQDSIQRALDMIAEDTGAGVLEPRRAPPETVKTELAVKVDPAVGLLAEALELIGMHGNGTFSIESIEAARKLRKKIEETDFTPMCLDRNEAAVAQGIDYTYDMTQDLCEMSSEALPRIRASIPVIQHRMPLPRNSEMAPQRKDAVSEREVDSYQHIPKEERRGN